MTWAAEAALAALPLLVVSVLLALRVPALRAATAGIVIAGLLVLTVLAGARLGGVLVTRVSTDHARTLALVLAGTGGAVTLVRGLTAL